MSLLDSVEPVLSAHAFQLQPAAATEALVAAGLLKPADYELATTSQADHDDIAVGLVWSPEQRSYGYFSPAGGWIAVRQDQITRRRIDIPVLLTSLLSRTGESKRFAPAEIVPGIVWDLGDIRLPHRTQRASIWFARRLLDPRVVRALREMALARPPGARRILLTSTPRERFSFDPVANHTVVSIHDVMCAEAFSIDLAALSARLDGSSPAPANDLLVVIGDGREVRLHGQVFKFAKGVEQRRIIAFLYLRYQRGELRVSTDEIVAELGLRANARIRDYFKKNNAWNVLLTERGGMCGFVLDSAVGTPAS